MGGLSISNFFNGTKSDKSTKTRVYNSDQLSSDLLPKVAPHNHDGPDAKDSCMRVGCFRKHCSDSLLPSVGSSNSNWHFLACQKKNGSTYILGVGEPPHRREFVQLIGATIKQLAKEKFKLVRARSKNDYRMLTDEAPGGPIRLEGLIDRMLEADSCFPAVIHNLRKYSNGEETLGQMMAKAKGPRLVVDSSALDDATSSMVDGQLKLPSSSTGKGITRCSSVEECCKELTTEPEKTDHTDEVFEQDQSRQRSASKAVSEADLTVAPQPQPWYSQIRSKTKSKHPWKPLFLIGSKDDDKYVLRIDTESNENWTSKNYAVKTVLSGIKLTPSGVEPAEPGGVYCLTREMPSYIHDLQCALDRIVETQKVRSSATGQQQWNDSVTRDKVDPDEEVFKPAPITAQVISCLKNQAGGGKNLATMITEATRSFWTS